MEIRVLHLLQAGELQLDSMHEQGKNQAKEEGVRYGALLVKLPERNETERSELSGPLLGYHIEL